MVRTAALLFPFLLATAASAQEGGHPILRQAREIQEKVAEMRGLRFQAEVKVGVQKPEDLRAMLVENFEKEAPAEEIAKQEAVLKRFGLLPADFDLRAQLLQFLSDQIGGFYDPEKKELFLIERDLGGMEAAQAMNDKMVMAHELHHALQDQNFGLDRWFELLGDHEDRVQGYKSLIEGEAQLVGMTYLFGNMGRGKVDLKQLNRMQEMMMKFTPEGAKFAKIPPYLLENMMFPYTQGAEFVQDMQRKGGWEAVTRAFADPPSSTEQVLHPERYYERDEPTEIVLPVAGLGKLLGEGAEELYQNTLGEYSASLVLRGLGANKGAAAKAVTGWDGDRFAGFRAADGRVVLVWLTTWDSERDAQEFREAYGPLLAKARPEAHLVQRGPEVLMIDGAQAGEREPLVRKAFMAVKAESHLRPLPGLLEKPLASDFDAEAAAPAASVAEAPATGGVTRVDPLGASFKAVAGLTPAPEGIAELADLGGARFAGESGSHVRLFALPRELRAAVEELDEAFRGKAQALTLTRSEPLRARGLAGHRMVLAGVLPGDAVSSTTHLVAIDRGVRGETVVVAVSHADPKVAEARFDALLASLWLDAPAARAATAWSLGGLRVAAALGDDWSAPEEQVVGDVRVAVRSSRRGPGRVQLSVAPAPSSLEAYVARLEAQLPLVQPGGRVVAAGVVTIGGRPTVEVELEAGGRRTRQRAFVHQGKLVTLSCSAPAAGFDARIAEFQELLASFELASAAEQPEAPRKERRAY